MDRYLIKKLGDVETVSLEDSNYIVSEQGIVNRLEEIYNYYIVNDQPREEWLKILTGG